MKISTTYTEKKEVEISLPIFRKQHTAMLDIIEYFAILEDKTSIKIYNSGNSYTSITHVPVERSAENVAEVFATWETIDEEEFLKAHAEILASLSFKPVLHEIEADDLKNVNI